MKKAYIIGAIIVLLIGGAYIVYHKVSEQRALQAEMVKVVKSQEVKKIIKDYLKSKDPKALTRTGIIKAYKIDEGSIKHNPMGGIMFDIYLNNDEELLVHFTLQKNNGVIEHSASGYSQKVANLIGERDD